MIALWIMAIGMGVAFGAMLTAWRAADWPNVVLNRERLDAGVLDDELGDHSVESLNHWLREVERRLESTRQVPARCRMLAFVACFGGAVGQAIQRPQAWEVAGSGIAVALVAFVFCSWCSRRYAQVLKVARERLDQRAATFAASEVDWGVERVPRRVSRRFLRR